MSPAPDVPECPSRSWRDLAAPIASGICLVHCVGLALLAPVLPAALTTVVDDPRLELALWASAAVLSLWMLLRSRALVPGAVFVGWAAGTAIGLAGVLRGESSHGLIALSLVVFSAVQIVAFVRRFRAHHVDHAHDACDHAHGDDRAAALSARALDPEPPR